MDFNEHLNILVGENEVGKSTIIEAINLALTGLLNGKYLKTELNQYLFNIEVLKEYFDNLKNPQADIPIPPQILIEIFFDGIEDDSTKALFEGNANSSKKKACGIQFKIALNEVHKPYYEELVKNTEINKSLPVEYYDFHWVSFARDETVTPSVLPIKPALIDSASSRYKNGSDIYISRIMRDHLKDNEKNAITQAHRKFKDSFDNDEAIKGINEKIKTAINISDKEIELSVDLSSQNIWETTLMTYLDKVPFHYIGKGEQTLIKTKLALTHKKTTEANVLLVEEPENHLSHTKLNKLINDIKSPSINKQIIMSTHSSFIANILNLGNLILLNLNSETKLRECMLFADLSETTREYFEKLAGYDTLRLILCKSTILVEGDSDELVVEKAYSIKHSGKLPIEDEKEVISVGTAFLRFLEISSRVKKRVAVVTDNDGDIDEIKGKYKDYIGENEKGNIRIYFDETVDTGSLVIGKQKKPFNYNTLEPKILKANGLEKMNKILNKKAKDINELHTYMHINKTESALQLFKSTEPITFPEYITKAIEFIDNEK